ncbi:MAG TPA: MATE family efflux transporter, partial [Nevskiaceae bacterium]|nr:MATE family efflux transporter [Nevskiaceae bacterium]
AGRLGARELAAVSVGSNVWFFLFVPFLGLSLAVSPIVAQRVGAGHLPGAIGKVVKSALALSLLLGIGWLLLMHAVIDPSLDVLALDAPTRGFAEDFLRAISWAAPPFCLCFFLRGGAEGHGLTRIPLYAGLVGLSCNVVFNYLLMWGNGGFPAMGPAGCGWATVIASWAMVGVYAAAYWLHPVLRELEVLEGGWPRLEHEVREIFMVGLPIAGILAAESWLFSAGALLMARFGAPAVAAHQIAINFAALAFMVPTAVGMATAVRVGFSAGARDAEGVALRGRAGIAIGGAFSLMSAAAMALLPGPIVAMYTSIEALAGPATHFLALAAIFQFFDCIQATANGALRGLKDTRTPMAITVFAYWGVGMPLAAGLAFWTASGPSGIWWGFIGGLALAAIGLSWRFAHLTSGKLPIPTQSATM